MQAARRWATRPPQRRRSVCGGACGGARRSVRRQSNGGESYDEAIQNIQGDRLDLDGTGCRLGCVGHARRYWSDGDSHAGGSASGCRRTGYRLCKYQYHQFSNPCCPLSRSSSGSSGRSFQEWLWSRFSCRSAGGPRSNGGPGARSCACASTGAGSKACGCPGACAESANRAHAGGRAHHRSGDTRRHGVHPLVSRAA